MKYKWVLFDLDNTLFDYDRAEADALRRAFEHAGCRFEPSYGPIYREINARLWSEFEQGRITQTEIRVRRFQDLFARLDIDLDPNAFSPVYLAFLSEGMYLVDGALAVVQALYGRAGLMLITNGLHEVQRPRLARSALNGYFAGLVISEEVGASKPNGGIFDAAFQQMGIPPKETVLMVGDSLSSDIQGGNLYGIDTCWFNPGRVPGKPGIAATYEIGSLFEILDLMEASGE